MRLVAAGDATTEAGQTEPQETTVEETTSEETTSEETTATEQPESAGNGDVKRSKRTPANTCATRKGSSNPSC